MTFSRYALLAIILTCILYGGKGIIECSRYLTLDWWFTFENRISRFDKKLRIAQYAEHSIYDYKLKIAQAVLYLQKLPDDFTQDDVEERGMQDQMGGYLLRQKDALRLPKQGEQGPICTHLLADAHCTEGIQEEVPQ